MNFTVSVFFLFFIFYCLCASSFRADFPTAATDVYYDVSEYTVGILDTFYAIKIVIEQVNMPHVFCAPIIVVFSTIIGLLKLCRKAL